MLTMGLRYWAPAIATVLILAGCGGDSLSSSSGSPGTAGTSSVTANGITLQDAVPPTAPAGKTYTAQASASTTSGSAVGFSIQNKPFWASFNTATGSLQGTPSTAEVGQYSNVVISASDSYGTASLPPFSITVTQAGATTTPSSAARPFYNTGDGFFVVNGTLYDPNGNEFRIRGVNRLHWDSNSAAGIALSGANTVRWDMDFTRDAATNVNEIQTEGIDNRNVPIVGNWTATCKSDPNLFSAAVHSWVSQASQWSQLNKYLIVNIANEWGPANSTVWRDSYISAIAQLRKAGYTGPLLIDSGGCGQDIQDLAQYSQAVFNSDPEKNVMFALHMYGSTNNYSASIQSVQRGNPTVITLASDSSTHPFAPGYKGAGNNWNGISTYQISGVQGMTQLNGPQPSLVNVGGSPSVWTITLSVDSTNWPAYTSGGTVVDYNGNYGVEAQRLAALSQQTGAVYIIGEFGPGQDIGPSPTMVTPAEIITAAETNGVGWLAWAWDDMDLGGCKANNKWFSMTYSCGLYTQPSDLTNYGQDVVLNPTYGLSVVAKPASIF